MKKLIVILFLLFSIIHGYAQKLHFGLKFNPTISWIKALEPTVATNNGIGLGFSYGLLVDYNIQDNYGLAFEIIHSTFNFGTTYTDSTNHTIINKLNQKYIEIPFALKMKTNEINDFTYFGKIGIAPQIRTAATLNKANNAENINLFNASVVIGAGVHYSLGGNTKVVAGISFYNGLLRFNKAKNDIFPDIKDLQKMRDNPLKISHMTIDLGIMF